MGEVIYLVNIVSGNSMGASVQTNEIDDGAVTYQKLTNNIKKSNLLETLTFSAVKTISSSADFSDYDLIILEGTLKKDASGSMNIDIRHNADTGSNYTQQYLGGGVVNISAGGNRSTLGTIFSNRDGYFLLVFTTKCSEVTGGYNSGSILSSGLSVNSTSNGLRYEYLGGNGTLITSITLFDATDSLNFSGKIKIYGSKL